MNHWFLSLMVFLLVGCTTANPSSQNIEPNISESSGSTSSNQVTNTSLPTNSLPNFGLAPELTNQVWLNTDAPLRLAELRGKVVLLEMWTFG